jgi:Fe(3+) dicitrate transport protein
LNYQLNDKTSLHFDYTYFNYQQQAGGLTDVMFNQNPTQSNRSRNWFCRLEFICLKLEHKFNNDADFSLQLFGLDAIENIGYRSNRVSSPDTEGTVRI